MVGQEELVLIYRPTLLKHLYGQEKAVSIVKGFLKRKKFPRQMMLTGPSGTGKTTLARIVGEKTKTNMDCDFREINAASENGIDIIRQVREHCRLYPTASKHRIFLLDEVHQLTKQAQNAFLKVLEEPPDHVIFILCTTDPSKVIKTIQTRCQVVPFSLVDDDAMLEVLSRIITKEDVFVSEKHKKLIIQAAEGSPRKAINLLETLLGIDDEDERSEVITKESTKLQCIDLCRFIFQNEKPAWKAVAKMFRDIEDEPEMIRRSITGYAAGILQNGQENGRAYHILVAFEADYPWSERSRLVRALYETMTKINK